MRLYAYYRTIADCYNENSSLILGTKGRCDLLNLRIQGETNWQHPGEQSKNSAYDLEHVALFHAIRSGTPLNNGDYMVRSTLIGLMGQFTCYSGKEVKWDQIASSNFSHGPHPHEVNGAIDPPVRPGRDGVYPLPYTPGISKLI